MASTVEDIGKAISHDFNGPVIFYRTRVKVKDVLAVLEKVERRG